ncbi:uncharacterized protein LOC110463779 isoform X1 [Mizuhopecten yessoensis]|uniref:N-acetyltransferase domain-containing protein n=2 Tax=Mizuhopecten yessoensis TaxID=6573 RepID=A0A210PVE2_MIZYE|nr:uncharacterized protein LOC110463779 isoform X1 [Mizuhopecten yessoensis]OWF40435.1 hypothetical protein KP79_PYT25109 [Mizuhopecten yessoensis]
MLSTLVRRFPRSAITTANRNLTKCVTRPVTYSIRQMEHKDLPAINNILESEKWVMEKAYTECAFKTDPSGFFVAEKDDGEIIGSHGYMSHADNVATMGLWMVKKEYRQSNVGMDLYGKIHKAVGNKNLGTFVWPYYQQKIKEEHGVQPTKAYMTWYNYGHIDQRTCKNKDVEDFTILPLGQASLPDLLEYDTEIHKVAREKYMRNWISHDKSKTCVAFRGGKVCGYGVLRSQDSYNQIAPLYADDKSVAKGLFRNLASEVPKGEKVGFSSPFENSSATEFAAINKMMKPGIPLVMIYKDAPVNVDTDKVFAVSSNSFGTC